MITWNAQIRNPGVVILAADVRCGPTNYLNDHIWELNLGGGEPPALAIQTTFGLRARQFRVFPRFVETDTAVVDPGTFNTSPSIKKMFPNYLEVTFSPFTGIDVISEYWVPTSECLSGRFTVKNSRLEYRNILLQLVALLYPSENGHRMAPEDIDSTPILLGKTGNLFPVIFMTGGPENNIGPYPALSIPLELSPGSSRQLNWVHAAHNDLQSSFQSIKGQMSISWEPEIAKLEIINQSTIDIETGDPEWNAAFALGLKHAHTLLVGPTKHLPEPSLIRSRQPEHGFSRLGDGSDYDHLWNGQLPLETDYLCTLLLPGSTNLAKGLLKNYLETQTQRGFIDLKPGLAGQRTRVLATPILAQIAWRIFQTTEDIEFLNGIFPSLLSFVHAWFTEQQDRDGDGLPEWTNPLQSGFDDHPIFSQWQQWSQGGDIDKVESPSLCAFLYNEIQILIHMARITKQSSPVPALEAFAENLKSAVEASWNPAESIFMNWDRESHCSPMGTHLGSREGPGEIPIHDQFEIPVRLSIQVETGVDTQPNIKVFIHGTGLSGNYRIERLEWEQFRWHYDRGYVCSDQVYKSLEHIEISGIKSYDKISAEIIDLSMLDQTLFLPLWAEMIDPDRASELIKETLLNQNKFWRSFGVPACYQPNPANEYPCNAVNLIWNNLIGEGLIKYGYQKQATLLVVRLMEAVIKNLKTDSAFYDFHLADSGRGFGERNALGGLPPLGLFLKTLGVEIISPTKVSLSGTNPFPWPVTIKFRGLIIFREKNKTKVTFPGGQSAIVKSPEKRLVSLESIQ